METPATAAAAAPATAPGATVADSTADSRAANKKVSQTCVTCRARKVRCDGRRNICSNCERLGFPCSFDDTAAAGLDGGGSSGGVASSAEGGGAAAVDPLQSIPRRRARQACQNCHARKARCTGSTPQCERCRALGIECVYRPGKRTRLSPASGSVAGDGNGREEQHYERGPSESSDRADPAAAHGAAAAVAKAGVDAALLTVRSCPSEILEALAMRTFDQFFRHIHHIPTFAFLHRASLVQRYRAGLVDRPLLLALVGITSLMTDLGPGTRELGKQCIAEAEALVLSRLDRPSTLGLQALVFVIHYRVLSGRFSSAFMLHGVASRFASALRLNHENTRLCFLARESRRRLMWALYMIDSSMANGYADFSLWVYRADAMNIQLPCNERNFEFDLPEKTEPLCPPPRGPDGSLPPLPDDIGFLALHVRIRSVRGRILQYTKDVTSSAATIDIATIPPSVAEIATELDSFAARLPVSFRWSEANVRLRTYSPRLCVFVMTHIWWEQCHCELYRLALSGLQEALPAASIAELDSQYPTFVQHCRDQVLEHASAMAEMFRLLLTLDNGVPVTDLDLPICLYQCVRLLFYVSRTNPDEPQLVPHDSFLELAGVCTQVLDRTVTTPATVRIRTNLKKLMAQGLSMEIAPSGRSTPDVVHMETEDDMSSLLQPIRPPLGGAAPATSRAPPHAANANRTLPVPTPAVAALGLAQQGPEPPFHGLTVENSSSGGNSNPPAMFNAFDGNMAASAIQTAATTAAGGPPTPTTAAPDAISDTAATNAAGAALMESPRPSSVPGQNSLDAFDLDVVDSFGQNDLESWFSGDWVTNNEFAAP